MNEKTKAGKHEVTEFCPSCETEVTMRWDTGKHGLHAYCPHCGNRLMLCSECDGECDYDAAADTCRNMKKSEF